MSPQAISSRTDALTQHIQPILPLNKLLRSLPRVPWVREIALQPHDLSFPLTRSELIFQLDTCYSVVRSLLAPACEVDFGVVQVKLFDGFETESGAVGMYERSGLGGKGGNCVLSACDEDDFTRQVWDVFRRLERWYAGVLRLEQRKAHVCNLTKLGESTAVASLTTVDDDTRDVVYRIRPGAASCSTIPFLSSAFPNLSGTNLPMVWPRPLWRSHRVRKV